MPNLDFEYYLSNNNPFTTKANVGGRPTSVAKTYSDFLNATNWMLKERAKQATANPFLSTAVWNPSAAKVTTPGGAWGGMASIGTTPTSGWESAEPRAGVIPPTSVGPFRALSLTKDPEIESDLNALLGRVREGNLSELTRVPRSEALNEMTGRLYQRYRGDVNKTDQSIADFNKEFLSLRPADRAALEQENQVLGSFYGGPEDPNSFIARLNKIAEDRARSVAGVTDQALGQMGRAGKSASMMGGQSSYLDKIMADTASRLLAQEKVDQANLARENLLAAAGYQTGLAGKRGDMLDAYLRRGLMPLQVTQQATAADLANLGQLGNVDLANLLTTTKGQELAQQLGLLGGASDLRRSIRYEDLQKMFEDPGYGMLPIPPVYPGGPDLPFNPFDLGRPYLPYDFTEPQPPIKTPDGTTLRPQFVRARPYNIDASYDKYLSTPEGIFDWQTAYGELPPTKPAMSPLDQSYEDYIYSPEGLTDWINAYGLESLNLTGPQIT